MSLKLKLTIILFIIFSALALGVVGVYAVLDIDFVVNGDVVYTYSPFKYTYDTENLTASVAASSTDLSGDIEIPATVMYKNQEYTVNAISENGFKDTLITTVTLPNTITTLNASAFNNCSELTNLNMPSGITEIPASCFYSCGKLRMVNLSYIKTMGINAFYNCQKLESINLPSAITEIPSGCFVDCLSLKSINLSYIKEIGALAFSGAGITRLVIPGSVTTIYPSTFYDCARLSSIVFSPGLTSINQYAFYGCTSLTTVDLPTTLTNIGDYAFQECTSLVSVSMQGSPPLKKMGAGVFKDCSSLVTVRIKGAQGFTMPNNAIPLNTGLQIIVDAAYYRVFYDIYPYYRNYFVKASE